MWSFGYHDPGRLVIFKKRFSKPTILRKYQLDSPCPLEIKCHAIAGRWKCNLFKDLILWLHYALKSNGHSSNTWNGILDASHDTLNRACRSTYWEWPGGSTLFFWCWPLSQKKYTREGYPIQITGPLPCYKVPLCREQHPTVCKQMRKKLQFVRNRRYTQNAYAASLTSYFSVLKGQYDIRMVCNATKSGLNKVIWVPNFSLSSIEAIMQLMDENM